jgi:riboflavin synthase
VRKMFTGLVEEIGTIRSVTSMGEGCRFAISGSKVLPGLAIGDSISVSVACLTVMDVKKNVFSVDAVQETLQRSTLRSYRVGTLVNLERALSVGSRLAGHFVQGHVDAIAEVMGLEPRAPGHWLTLRLPRETMELCVEKGSIAVDGVSLTIAEVNKNSISIAVIHLSAAITTLSSRRTGDRVNVETDILGKYVRRFMVTGPKNQEITLEKLSEWGF